MKIEKTLNELIEIVPDAPLVTDTDGIIVPANDLLCRMFGYDRNGLEGKSRIPVAFVADDLNSALVQ